MQYRTHTTNPVPARATRRPSSQSAPPTRAVKYYETEEPEEDDGYIYETRPRTSVVRAPSRSVIRTHVRTEEPDPTFLINEKTRLRIVIGSGFVAICIGLVLVFGYIIPAFNNWHDDVTYGYPRHTQWIEANVGHGTGAYPNTIFEGINDHGNIEVIEKAEDMTKLDHSFVYMVAQIVGNENSSDADKSPISDISFRDINGDGKPDMIVTVRGTAYVEYNDGTKFQQPKSQS